MGSLCESCCDSEASVVIRTPDGVCEWRNDYQMAKVTMIVVVGVHCWHSKSSPSTIFIAGVQVGFSNPTCKSTP